MLTTGELLGYIAAAVLVQLAALIGWGVWRRQAVPPVAAGPLTPRAGSAAWPGLRDFRVVSRSFEDRAHSQCSFRLAPVDGEPLPPYQPGQFLTFVLPVPGAAAPGGVEQVTRCYSLSDRPDPAAYRITVKRAPPPAGDQPPLPPGAASNHFHDAVKVGDVVAVRAPAGQFVLSADAAVPVVLIAGGIGITPLLCMAATGLAAQPQRRIQLFYGVRHGGELAFGPALAALAALHPNFRVTTVFSRPGSDDVAGRDYDHAGHIDIDLLRRTLPHGRHRFYLCGPAAMLESLVPALLDWGVAREDVHFEAFGPASIRLAAPAAAALTAPVAVHFRVSGRTIDWDGGDANLLDFAERHGVSVESGCRSGSCGACETRLVDGQVDYASPPDHEIAPGACLLCVGTPASALVLDA